MSGLNNPKTYYLEQKRITLAMAALSYGGPEPLETCGVALRLYNV